MDESYPMAYRESLQRRVGRFLKTGPWAVIKPFPFSGQDGEGNLVVGGVSPMVEPVTTFGFLVGQSILSVVFLLMNEFSGLVPLGGTPSSYFFFACMAAC